MNRCYICFKTVLHTDNKHYQTDNMNIEGNYSDQVVLTVFDEKFNIINWIYPSEFKQNEQYTNTRS